MLVDSVAGAFLVAGAAACAGAAVRGRRSRPGRAGLALALALAGAGELADLDWALIAGCGVATVAIALLVFARIGHVDRMAGLDAVLCATAAAAVVVGAGADATAGVAAAAVTAGFALSRWQISLAMALIALGIAALGLGEDAAPAAALPFAAAAWRREERLGPGPDFRWTVLAAIILFATAALTVLAIGQFTEFSDVAGVLALLTVLTGIARGGITVTDRLRESNARAMSDELTGLANRRHLIERLQAAIEPPGDALALLLIDLDGFKELNDTLGHHAGDQVLRQIGPRLGGAIREHDTLARLGGDEFALVLAPGDEATASTAGLRLRRALERSFHVEDIAVHVDASVGIALFPEHARDPIGLLQRADVAMYEAKRMRTGHEVYLAVARPPQPRAARARGRAARRDRGRPAHPALPAEGRPAGRHGRRRRGARALAAPAARAAHARALPAAGGAERPHARADGVRARPRARGARRVRPRHDRRGQPGAGRPARLRPAGRRRAGAGAPRLTRAAHARGERGPRGRDPERTLEVLRRLRALGVRLALDDFGAGQSSLRHLRELELDELKVDRQFVLGMAGDARDLAIVAATVDLGHRLGLRVVGEGVATQATWEILAAHGCDEAQGDLLSRPLPAAELRAWLLQPDPLNRARSSRG